MRTTGRRTICEAIPKPLPDNILKGQRLAELDLLPQRAVPADNVHTLLDAAQHAIFGIEDLHHQPPASSARRVVWHRDSQRALRIRSRDEWSFTSATSTREDGNRRQRKEQCQDKMRQERIFP